MALSRAREGAFGLDHLDRVVVWEGNGGNGSPVRPGVKLPSPVTRIVEAPPAGSGDIRVDG